MANTTIRLKKSGVVSNVPASLELGELALNYADGKLYYKNSEDVITYISSGATTNSFATINANSGLIIATSNTDILSLVGSNNITISSDGVSKTITIGSRLTDSLTLGDPQIGASSNSVANLYSIVLSVQNLASTAGQEAVDASNYAGSAYNQANIATSLAQSAYDYANTITGGGGSNTSINYISNTSIEFTSATANQVIDTFSTASWRTAKYLIQCVSGSDVHSTELFLTHNDTNVLITQYGEIYTTNLMSLDAEIVSGNLNLMITPVNTTGYVDVVRTSLIARTMGGGTSSGDLMTLSGTEDLGTGTGTEDLLA